MSKVVKVHCRKCGRVETLSGQRAAALTQKHGCQVCRLAEHMPAMLPAVQGAVLDWMARSHQTRILNEALDRSSAEQELFRKAA